MSTLSDTFDPEDIPVANDCSRDDFGSDDEVRGWNLCRDYVIGMVRPSVPVPCRWCGQSVPQPDAHTTWAGTSCDDEGQ